MFECSLVDHTDDVCSVAFAPGGDLLITGSADGNARLWKLESGRSPRPIVDFPHTNAVSSVDFHPRGTHVCTACADSDVRVWRVQTNARALQTSEPTVLRGHSEAAWSCAFSPSGQHVVSASSDRTVALWDWQSSSRVGVLRGHTAWVSEARFNLDGSLVCSASRDRSLRIWDVGSLSEVLELWGHAGWTTRCAFGRGGSGAGSSLVFSAGHDKVVRQWDLNTGMEACQYTGHVAGVYGLAVSPDGRVIATASWDGTCRVWSTLMQRELTVLPLAPGVASQPADFHTGWNRRISTSRGLSVDISLRGCIAVGLNGGALRYFDPPKAENVAPDVSPDRTQTRNEKATAPAAEEWLADALIEHLTSDTRVDHFLNEKALMIAEAAGVGGKVGASISVGDRGDEGNAKTGRLQLVDAELHGEYAELMVTLIDEVREAFDASVGVMAATITWLAKHAAITNEPNVLRQVERIDAVDDLALMSALLARHARSLRHKDTLTAAPGPCASEDDAKRVMEEELVALRARLDEERALRQREAEEHEQQRLADLQARLDLAVAKDNERSKALEEVRQQAEALADQLERERAQVEQERQQSELSRAADEQAHRNLQLQEQALAAEREDAAYKRAIADMEAAAAEERKRRDEHDALVAERISALEKERAAAQASKEEAVGQMETALRERQQAEMEQKDAFDKSLRQMEAELLRLRAAADSTEEAQRQANALELKIAQQERTERQRRSEVEAQHASQQQQIKEQQEALVTRDAAIEQLEKQLEVSKQDEQARRARHEQEFHAALETQKQSASLEVSAAIEQVRTVTAELEQQREIESRLRAEMAAREKEQERLRVELESLKQLQRKAQEEAATAAANPGDEEKLSQLTCALRAKEEALKEAERAKSKARKKAAARMLEKDKALDDMRAARLQDEERIRFLEKEKELARAERDRLSQALKDLTEEQNRRAAEEQAQEKQRGKLRMCLDISDDSIDVTPVKGKEELIEEAEQGRAFLLRSHAKERDRQEELLRERMELRNRRRGAGQNRWEEASMGGIAVDKCVPGGLHF